MSEPIPQDAALRLQLAAIAGDEPEGYFEIRGKRPGGMHREFVPIAEVGRTMRTICKWGELSDTYVGACVRAREEGTAAAVERGWTLWGDFDGAEALERLAAFDPLPSIVIRSGSDRSAHAYWPLSSPLTGEQVRAANRRLAAHLGADMRSTDAARILRPIGTWNYKHSPRRPVICTRCEVEVFTAAQVLAHVPQLDDRAPQRNRRDPAAQRAFTGAALTGILRTVSDAPEGNRNAALFWGACRLGEHGLDDTNGRRALREAALTAGLTEFEVDRTIRSALHPQAVAA